MLLTVLVNLQNDKCSHSSWQWKTWDVPNAGSEWQSTSDDIKKDCFGDKNWSCYLKANEIQRLAITDKCLIIHRRILSSIRLSVLTSILDVSFFVLIVGFIMCSLLFLVDRMFWLPFTWWGGGGKCNTSHKASVYWCLLCKGHLQWRLQDNKTYRN